MTTEPRWTTDELREIEARYRALFETMGPAVLLLRGAECIDCNPATLAMFGVDRREDLLGKTPLDFAPDRQSDGTLADGVRRNFEQALAHGTHTFQWQSVRKNGDPFVMEVSFTPCGAPSEELFLCIAVDITERRRAERALRASEERFRAIVERAAEGIIVADAETRTVRYANPEMCQLLGFTLEELVGKGIADLHPEEARERVLEGFARQSPGVRLDMTFPMLRKDGSSVEVSVRGTNVELDGRPCVVGLFTDLTERRRIEAERLRTQKLEALASLAGGIAHDFNNLLQGIFGFISAARLTNDIAEARALLGESEQALSMAARLTGQLLTFSVGGTPLKRPVAVGSLAERAARFALSGSAVGVQCEIPDDVWAADGDEGQLEQVVQNIVLNGAQAMPQGGTVLVGARNLEAPGDDAPAGLAPGRYVVVSIADAGSGIPDEFLPRIFDPYFTSKQRGSGLGLATAYSIVRAHGGTITVRSELGVGSTFLIYLPASQRPAVVPGAVVAPVTARTARILVMDDEPLIRKASARVLKTLGHDVDATADGADAVEAYRTAIDAGRPYDAVILDLTVPGGMGGLETLARLKAIDPDVKAVVSSGYSDDAAIAHYEAHGFRAALRKPYTRDQLAEVLAALLG